MVDDLVNLLDHLEIENAHFAGYSMGAEIILKLATLHPDRVQSLVIGGSGWSGQDESAFYQLVARSLDDGSGLGGVIRALNPEATDEEEASADEMLRGQDLRALGRWRYLC